MNTPDDFATDAEDIALVIGAGGMSVAVARRLSQRYPVIIADLDGARAADAAARLRAEGGRATGLPCDVTRAADADRLAETVAAHGRLRAVAHVTGLSPSLADSPRSCGSISPASPTSRARCSRLPGRAPRRC